MSRKLNSFSIFLFRELKYFCLVLVQALPPPYLLPCLDLYILLFYFQDCIVAVVLIFHGGAGVPVFTFACKVFLNSL